VTRSEFDAVDGRLDLYVDFPPGSRFACAQCGRDGCAVHDTKEETWRHLDFFQHRTLLHARTPRVTCPECGVRKVVTPWARPGSGFTLLFEAYVLALAKTMPIKDCVEKKVRRHLTQARNRRGFGWTRWNRQWLYRRRSNRLPPKF
jgi:transposase